MLGNWSRSLSYSAARIHRPHSVEELQELIAGARRVKALGTRHSFNAIADTEGDLVSTENLNRILSLDTHGRRVTVEPGVRYGELGQYLQDFGLALPNYASLPHISVGGACATATHGSGDRRGNLATSVAEMEMAMADGQIAIFTGQELHASAVHLGALGIVAKLTLSVVPAFEVSQVVYEQLPFETAFAHFEEIMGAGYSVSLFTDWSGASFNQVWVKRLASQVVSNQPFFGARPAVGPVHPIPDMSGEWCTEQMGVPGPSVHRLPHFKLEFTPSSGEEIQSEYLVPRTLAVAALEAVRTLSGEIALRLQISEVRSISADSRWMSPCFERDAIGIHFTWKNEPDAVLALLPQIEDALEPFEARPHWGKVFSMAPEQVRVLYPKGRDFVHLADSIDPEGKFRNAFLDRYVFGEGDR